MSEHEEVLDVLERILGEQRRTNDLLEKLVEARCAEPDYGIVPAPAPRIDEYEDGAAGEEEAARLRALCTGTGRCHGKLNHCIVCGDVSAVCDVGGECPHHHYALRHKEAVEREPTPEEARCRTCRACVTKEELARWDGDCSDCGIPF